MFIKNPFVNIDKIEKMINKKNYLFVNLNYYELIYFAEKYAMVIPIQKRDNLTNLINNLGFLALKIEEEYKNNSLKQFLSTLDRKQLLNIINYFYLKNVNIELTELGKELLDLINIQLKYIDINGDKQNKFNEIVEENEEDLFLNR